MIRKIKNTLLILIFSMTSLNLLSGETDDAKSNLNKIQKQINLIDKKIKENSKVKKGLNRSLKKHEKEISATKKEIFKVKKKQKSNKKKLATLNKKLKKLEKELFKRRQLQNEILYQSYIKPKPGYLQLFIEGINPNEVSRQINYIGYLTKAQNDNILKIDETRKNIRATKKSTKKILKNVTQLRKKKEKNAKKLEKKKKEKKLTLNKISKKLKSQKSKKLKLQQDEKKLSSLVKNLMLKLKAQEKRRKTEKKDIKKEKKVIDERAYKVNFAKLKKKLKLPVKGKVIYKYNAKRSDTGTRWKGLFIKAKEGSNVKSVASGQVVFSDWLRGFGNIIIIDHGKSYMSLYGNNDSLLKQKGEFIKGGEVIALSGNSGGNKYNGLYYELRHNGKPFNPLKWTK
ncbi:peptidoglycan DD-metalloendopeptidase family protein [Methylophilaceae bacterium]|nr:peptidoglycan DD-metalloendopeptidase family protein [Methylophilaceae bacterium]